MLKFIRKQKWYKKFIRKQYEQAHPYRVPTKWDLRYNGYQIKIYDMAYFGEFEQIRIVENNEYDGRVFRYDIQDGRKLTVSYLMNEYAHLPSTLKNRMKEILVQLDIPDDSVDKLEEKVDEFFGYEEL